MYSAKSQGKNTWFLYNKKMDGDRLGDAHLKGELNHSIEMGELEALFQPLVELPTQRVVGLEALVRWNHPTQGQLSPDVFLPIAEETGFIYDIDLWMLKEACTQAVAWREEGADPFSISINLSGVTLRRDEIVDDIARILEETGITPSDVILEITENVFVHNDAVWRLTELKKLGVRLAIDDFGTGYSSLNYLKRFPIDILKIDKSFIDGNNRQPGADLTKAIVMLAEALRLDTVAEGIETQDQVGPLSVLGVDQGQGFLFARPLSQQRVGAILQREQTQESDETPLEPSSGV
jgi:EAL domain-containing protein (putative c-di-GMP-specific phosphodiesterase class I)